MSWGGEVVQVSEGYRLPASAHKPHLISSSHWIHSPAWEERWTAVPQGRTVRGSCHTAVSTQVSSLLCSLHDFKGGGGISDLE